MRIVDTDVLIDIQRGSESAVAWVSALDGCTEVGATLPVVGCTKCVLQQRSVLGVVTDRQSRLGPWATSWEVSTRLPKVVL